MKEGVPPEKVWWPPVFLFFILTQHDIYDIKKTKNEFDWVWTTSFNIILY